jgi:hypothetical protein
MIKTTNVDGRKKIETMIKNATSTATKNDVERRIGRLLCAKLLGEMDDIATEFYKKMGLPLPEKRIEK